MTRLMRIQLLVFALTATLAIGYGSIRYFGADKLISRPYEVTALFSYAGGIYPRADVELLGTRVGTVSDVAPGPDGTTRVTMAIDKDVRIPRDVELTVSAKSAIGEQVIAMTPKSAGAPYLRTGDSIALSATKTPVRVEDLLANTDALLASIPAGDLNTALKEASTALAGVGADLRSLIQSSQTVSASTLEHIDELRTLIGQSQTVLNTQLDLDPQTRASLADTGDLLARVQTLKAPLLGIAVDGTRAAQEVSAMLLDIRTVLPALLGDFNALTDVALARKAALRKTIALFPWALEAAGYAVRYCDKYNPKTGEPVESTCHYDEQGKPIYHAYFAFQLPELPGNPPFLPCNRGYEDTRRFQPDGTAMDGGPSFRFDSTTEPDLSVGCTSSPSDPAQPNVRGSQNVR